MDLDLEPTLKPCPNCGYDGDMDQVSTSTVLDENSISEETAYQVSCPVCGMSGPVEPTLEQAELRWEQLPRSNTPPAMHLIPLYLQRSSLYEDEGDFEEIEDDEDDGEKY